MHSRSWLRMTVSILALAGTALLPRSSSAELVVYFLEEGSEFQDGCQEGCACPVSVMRLDGTFRLTPAGHDGDFDAFAVGDVLWVIHRAGRDETVTGSGTFRIGRGAGAVQRLELDLSIAGRAPVHFDSGLVAAVAELPEMRVAVAMNDFFCYDNVFSLRARPDVRVSVEEVTWTRIRKLLGVAVPALPR